MGIRACVYGHFAEDTNFIIQTPDESACHLLSILSMVPWLPQILKH